MKISESKISKISEQILAYLFSVSPKAKFTSHIAGEIVRDEEFTKKILLILKNKRLVDEIKKNPSGKEYLLRRRWKLSDEAYKAYMFQQNRY